MISKYSYRINWNRYSVRWSNIYMRHFVLLLAIRLAEFMLLRFANVTCESEGLLPGTASSSARKAFCALMWVSSLLALVFSNVFNAHLDVDMRLTCLYWEEQQTKPTPPVLKDCRLCFASYLAFQCFTRKHCLQLSGLKIGNITWNRFPIKNWRIDKLAYSFVGSSNLNIDMREFKSSQKDESRAQSTHSSKAYRKPRAFNYCFES